MSEPIDPEEVKLWLARLQRESESDRVQAASELSRLRLRTRGAVRTRGTLSRSAPAEFPAAVPGGLSQILTVLQQERSPAVRREVAAAVGAWGGARAAAILSALVTGSEQDSDESVRRAGVRALGLIGGREAVQALCAAAEHDQAEAVRREAIGALADLALQERPHSAVRGPGRGVVKNVSDTLERIQQDAAAKSYLRHLAEAGLNALQIEPD